MSKISKSEARIARRQKKTADRANKNARLSDVVRKEVAARFVENPSSTYQMKVDWAADAADVLESWSWGVARQWTQSDWDNTILPKLKNFEELTWAEVDALSSDSGHKMHHGMPTSSICEEAIGRLWTIEKYQDDMFRFRLGNLPRLWGFKQGSVFQILWYDPTHQIYPV